MKKILIIGANGFTGRQILNDLSVHAQYKVTGCSLHPDISPNDVGKYRFIETDIRNEADIKCLFEESSTSFNQSLAGKRVPIITFSILLFFYPFI